MTKKIKTLHVLISVLALTAVSLSFAYFMNTLRPFSDNLPSNALMVIVPYKYAGTWVFDDEAVGLEREPFVSGIPEMIDEMVQDIPHADQGFRLLFSTQPFPGYTHKLVWLRGDKTGNWYYCPLCLSCQFGRKSRPEYEPSLHRADQPNIQ